MAEIEIVQSYNELVKNYGKYIDIIKNTNQCVGQGYKKR